MSDERAKSSRRKRDNSGLSREFDEQHVKGAGQADGGRPVGSQGGFALLAEMRVDPGDRGVSQLLDQLGQNAGLEDPMRPIDGSNFFRRRIGNEGSALRNSLEPSLGDESVQDLADALARYIEKGRQTVLGEL